MIRPRRNRSFALGALAVLVAVGVGRIVAGYGDVSQTIDEASHIATGIEWLDRGTYRLNPESPPLARVAVGLGPWLAGHVRGETFDERTHPLEGPHASARALHLARLGTLPFFAAAALLVWWWGGLLFGAGAALAGAALFTWLPPVLAHAGLATTDVAASATITGLFVAFALWLERRSTRRDLALGVALALALGTKFSVLPFFAAGGAAILALRLAFGRGHDADAPAEPTLLRSAALVLGVAALVVWSLFRFSVGSIGDPENRPYKIVDATLGSEGALHDAAYALIEAPVVPAPELLAGVGQMVANLRDGATSYLLGETSESGFVAYYPVALGVKTPLGFLALAGLGTAFTWRRFRRERRWPLLVPPAVAAAVVVSLLPASVNVGVRHVLLVYLPLAALAGAGAAGLWNATPRPALARATALVLVTATFAASVAAHPAYLSYFNALAAGADPPVLNDSDLDWGQDVGRLAEVLRERGIREVHLGLFTTADLSRFDWPERTQRLEPGERVGGWVAASLFRILVSREFAWLAGHEPVERVGASIRLYRLPEPAASQGSTSDGGTRVKR